MPKMPRVGHENDIGAVTARESQIRRLMMLAMVNPKENGHITIALTGHTERRIRRLNEQNER